MSTVNYREYRTEITSGVSRFFYAEKGKENT